MSTPAVRSTVHACGSWCSVSRRRGRAWGASFIPWSLPPAVRGGRRGRARGCWEGIIHSLVAAHGDSRAQRALAAGAGLIVHDIPLLAESGPSGPWARRLDAVVVVDCLAETQIE